MFVFFCVGVCVCVFVCVCGIYKSSSAKVMFVGPYQHKTPAYCNTDISLPMLGVANYVSGCVGSEVIDTIQITVLISVWSYGLIM